MSPPSHLFIQLYLDEDVSALVAALLRSRGFTARTTLEAAQIGASDESQLEYATEHEMAILTHNRVHFESLAARYIFEGKTHWGIIAAARRPAHQLVNRLLRLLDEITADEMKNQLRYL
jgi:hypothetical protein